MKTLLFILLPFFGVAQCSTIDTAFKQQRDKNNKLTHKDCYSSVICPDVVQFWVSQTSVQTFYLLEGSVWMDHKQKLVKRVEKDGHVLFVTDKTIFGYKI